MTPGMQVRVVNSYAAASLSVPVSSLSSDDLPTDGKPAGVGSTSAKRESGAAVWSEKLAWSVRVEPGGGAECCRRCDMHGRVCQWEEHSKSSQAVTRDCHRLWPEHRQQGWKTRQLKNGAKGNPAGRRSGKGETAKGKQAGRRSGKGETAKGKQAGSYDGART
eukprot:358404-Chlamydomonas_euryale.AAC.20